MKKLVFTAIAMVAFCGASMVNTIEIKEGVVSDKKKETTSVVKEDEDLRINCSAAGNAAYGAVIRCGGSSDKASDAAWDVIYACNHG